MGMNITIIYHMLVVVQEKIPAVFGGRLQMPA